MVVKHPVGSWRTLLTLHRVTDPEIGTVLVPIGTSVRVKDCPGRNLGDNRLHVTTFEPGMRHYTLVVKPGELF